MKPQIKPADDRARIDSAPESHDEQELIGDQTHDHLWWGQTGRLTERKSSLAGDNASLVDEGGAKDRDVIRGGHDDDWRNK